MTLDANALRKLAALALNTAQMAGVLDVLASMTEKDEARKEAQRERTRKFREKIGVTLQSQHGNSDTSRVGVTRVEDKPLTQKTEDKEESKKDALRSDVEDFKAELSPFLNADQLNALLKLRRQKKAVVSGHAARLFIGAATKCGLSLSEAADKCVERNWISIEPGWLTGNARASPKPTLADAFAAFGQELELRDVRSQTGNDGAAKVIPYLSAVRSSG